MNDEPVYTGLAALYERIDRDLFEAQVSMTINALPEATAWEYPSWT